MQTKRILSWLLAMILLVSLAACGEKTPPAGTVTPLPTEASAAQTDPSVPLDPTEATTPRESTVTPLLYKVTDQEGHVAWLFGSIHVGRESFYPLPEYVLTAFDGADALAVEADIIAFEEDLGQQMDAIMCLVYTDGTSIKDHISPELYDRAVAAMTEMGAYMSLFDMYCPAMWSSLVDSLMLETVPGIDINLGIDRHLLERAKAAEKPIIEIESAKEQYEMLASFSPELQALLLESSLDSCEDPKAYEASISLLLKMWADGNEEALAAYMSETDSTQEMTPEEEALYEEYNKAMLNVRNVGMADYAVEALESGREVFICVGAAHVVGNGALVELLTEYGYTVEVVK